MAQYMHRISKGRAEVIFLDGVTGTDTGKWFETDGLEEKVLDISGITTATCQVFGSNAASKPLDATDGRQIGSDITADTLVEIGFPMKYMKVKCSAYTSGTIHARMLAKG